jgi:hypothetical protein
MSNKHHDFDTISVNPNDLIHLCPFFNGDTFGNTTTSTHEPQENFCFDSEKENLFDDGFDVNMFLNEEKENKEILRLQEILLKQREELFQLKERNEILKYNIKQKEKVKNHVFSVYGFSFETTNFPIAIIGQNATILSWNKAAAVSLIYF